MRTKRVIYTTITDIMVQLVTFAAGLIVPGLLLRNYGSEINGLRSSVVQIIGYLALIEMGIGGALTYELYKPLAEKNRDKINSIISAARAEYIKTGLLFSGLLVLMMVFYPYIIQNNLRSTATGLIFAVGLTNISSYFISGKLTVILTADQRGYIVNICKLGRLILQDAILILLMMKKINIAVVYLASFSATVLNIILIAVIVKKIYPWLNINVPPDKTAVNKRYDVLTHQISGIIVSGVPVLVLTFLGDLKVVSVYSVYMIIFGGVNMLLSVFNNGFVAGFGGLISKSNKEKINNTYSLYEFLFYMIMSVVFICVILLSQSFILIYTADITDINYINTGLLYMFVIYAMLTAVKLPQTTMIISSGKYKETRVHAVGETIITVCGCLFFGIISGIEGVLAGSILGLVFRQIDVIYVIKLLKINYKKTIRRILRILCSIFCGVWICKNFILENAANSYIEWIKNGTAVFSISFMTVIIINSIAEPKMLKELIKRINILFAGEGIRMLNINKFKEICGFYDAGVSKTEREDLPYALSLVFKLSSFIVDNINKGPTYEYFHHYRTVNSAIDRAVYLIGTEIERLGYRYLPIAASQTVGGNETMRGLESHKKAAVNAGLGVIGRNALFIANNVGAGVRLGTIFTDYPFENIENKPAKGCIGCGICAKKCPSNAIYNIDFDPENPNEALLDTKACSDYMKKAYQHIGRGSVCGICVSNCPMNK